MPPAIDLEGVPHAPAPLALAATAANPEQQPEAQVPAQKPAKTVVGIIYPPPEVRNIVDKTASFVARNGPEFESRIRQNELNNPKFNFLNSGDPYHAYYQHRVEAFRDGKAEPAATSKPLVAVSLTPSTPSGGVPPVGLATPQVRAGQEMFRPPAEREQAALVTTEPPPEYEFTADPPSIAAVDLDIVKLTAQFVARNGRQFLTNLMNREQRNYQFDFLRPQHSLFQYFTRLLEQYTKVLIPPKDLMAKLSVECDTPAPVLEQVQHRVEWHRLQEARRRREQEALERERVSYAQIDWHDFVVVETVDYQPWEQGQFPPPTTPAQVGQRVLMQERIDDGEEMQMSDEEDAEPEPEAEQRPQSSSDESEDEEEEEEPEPVKKPEPVETPPAATPGVTDNTQVQDMEEDSDEEEEPRRPVPPPPPPISATKLAPPLPPKLDQVVIKKYDPKAVAKPSRAPAPDEFLISPITGERIPADKVAEHMRIGLLDPRWVEQRDRQLNEKVNQETVFATGGDIGSHLQNLAERRTDIFGAGDEETIIGKKIGEEEKRTDDKLIWDGHKGSMGEASRAARAAVTIEDHISRAQRDRAAQQEKDRIGPQSGTGSKRPPPPEKPPTRDDKPAPPPPPPPPPPASKAPAPPPPPPKATPPPPPPPRLAPQQPQLRPAPGPLLLRPPLMAQGVMMAPRPPVMAMGARPMFMQPMPAGFMAPLQHPGGPLQVMSAPEPVMVAGEDEPPSKKARTEESLVPENQWLARHPTGQVTFRVSVPTVSDKAEWRLSGQTLSLTMPLTDMVSVVKARLHDETGLPPGKQKLLVDGIFFKDSNTLAYYNVGNGGVIQLQLKERGGRKK